jgi:pimeloyl-ACP methyl ester carboxylesterase
MPTSTGKAKAGSSSPTRGRFNKESWQKQARTFASAGFRVLAFDLRGYGCRAAQVTLPP